MSSSTLMPPPSPHRSCPLEVLARTCPIGSSSPHRRRRAGHRPLIMCWEPHRLGRSPTSSVGRARPHWTRRRPRDPLTVRWLCPRSWQMLIVPRRLPPPPPNRPLTTVRKGGKWWPVTSNGGGHHASLLPHIALSPPPWLDDISTVCKSTTSSQTVPMPLVIFGAIEWGTKPGPASVHGRRSSLCHPSSLATAPGVSCDPQPERWGCRLGRAAGVLVRARPKI
jgi:hypothetical protein